MSWISYFLPVGRIPRLPYIGVTIAIYVVFMLLIMAWSRMDTDAGRLWIDLPLFALFTVKFIAAAKRLHDIGLSGLWAAPVLILLATGLYNNYAVQLLHAPSLFLPGFITIGSALVSYSTIAAMALLVTLVLTDVLLCLMPGNTGQNRYGQGLHNRESVITDVF